MSAPEGEELDEAIRKAVSERSGTVNIGKSGETTINITRRTIGESGVEREDVEVATEEVKINDLESDIEQEVEERLQRESEPKPEPEPEPTPEPEPEPTGGPDDLESISGIGESTAEKLRDMGVTTVEGLRRQFQVGGAAVGEISALHRENVADQLGVAVPENIAESSETVDQEPEEEQQEMADFQEIFLIVGPECPGCESAKEALSEEIEAGVVEVRNLMEDDDALDMALAATDERRVPLLIGRTGNEVTLIR